jgi:hypothetical protein
MKNEHYEMLLTSKKFFSSVTLIKIPGFCRVEKYNFELRIEENNLKVIAHLEMPANLWRSCFWNFYVSGMSLC